MDRTSTIYIDALTGFGTLYFCPLHAPLLFNDNIDDKVKQYTIKITKIQIHTYHIATFFMHVSTYCIIKLRFCFFVPIFVFVLFSFVQIYQTNHNVAFFAGFNSEIVLKIN